MGKQPMNMIIITWFIIGRPTKYKDWAEDQLQRAISEVQSGKSVRCAAELYNVPKSTLQDRVSGRVAFGARSGPESYLSANEEEELVSFIENCSDIGYSRSKKQIIALVQQVMNEKGRDVTVSLGWWASFSHRHPQLTLRKAEPVSVARALGTRAEIIQRYFDLLEKTLLQYDLLEKPASIFNMDETGLSLDPGGPKVIGKKGTKHPVSTTTGDKSQITVVSCVSAAGYAMPPMVIFDRKTLSPGLTKGEVPGTMYGLSSNGWIDSELFTQWFCHHFLAYAPPVRPLLLLLDGHSTHFNPVTVEKAAKEKVIMFCLPPHSSHRTQPLDKGCFGPLKQFWKQECHDHLVTNPGKVVTRYDFSQLFSRAWYKGMSMVNVIQGFSTTGIYPLNSAKLLPASPPHNSICQRTGLEFIPLFSPVPSRPLRESTRAPETPQKESPREPIDLSFESLPRLSCSRCSSVSSSVSIESVQSVPEKQFTKEEVALFEKRLKEGFDLHHDSRYNLWLSSRQGNHIADKSCVALLPPVLSSYGAPCKALAHKSTISKLIDHSVPAIQLPEIGPKSSARVLTSDENRRKIMEKECEKRQKEQEKKERAVLREEKRKERLLLQEEKKRKKEEKIKEQARLKEDQKRKGMECVGGFHAW